MKIISAITALAILVLILWLMLLRYYRSTRSKTQAALVESALVSAGDDLAANSIPRSRDDARWAFINEWHLEPAADDRRPMNDAVPASSGSASARRSSARRCHQINYKEWSKERRDQYAIEP